MFKILNKPVKRHPELVDRVSPKLQRVAQGSHTMNHGKG